MITEPEFWERVDVLLDARHDPFDDAEVARALLQDPRRLAHLEALLARLDALAANDVAQPAPAVHAPTQPAPPATPPAPAVHAWRRHAAAALLLLGAGALAWTLRVPASDAGATRTTPHDVARSETVVARTRPPRARIVSVERSVRHRRVDAEPSALRTASSLRLGSPAGGLTASRPVASSTWKQTWTVP